ncbi:hypothetical protein SLEP1_g37433 [Rubroshorea leprosula]|uniref:Maternal effect embryo arrest 60 n=1 Tax=Rubroshorea leprosula TaxID=152421 RepID=A0AAV5KUZ7_9ROSI|nr:hypothetical protein SLEP1_g37433 [Rubroshorea leprosula]
MTTNIHVTALDGIVNVNSLFTFAVFIGLTWNPTDPNGSDRPLISDPKCAPTRQIVENLISFHVYSFSSFLFSSIIALALKQALRISKTHYFNTELTFLVKINKNLLRIGMLISAVGSVSGCGFLMLALINVVQVKLGTLACGSSYAFSAVVPLVIFVPAGLFIYSCLVLYAFTR